MKSSLVIVALSMVLVAGPVYAQQAPAGQTQGGQTPAGQTPAAQTPATQQQPATQQPAPAAQPPRPFPQGATIAYVNVQRVAAESAQGKGATAKITALREKKEKELQEKNQALEAARKKFETSGSVLSDTARSQQQKEIERMTVDLQRATQDAQAEVEELQRELQMDFQRRLLPVIEEVRASKNLLMVFSSLDSGILAADAGLDITAEVIKRFDATAASAPAQK
ncbi:MAG TPA: OmpH family outer membrane protein [Vicinamibacterales bacterium]